MKIKITNIQENARCLLYFPSYSNSYTIYVVTWAQMTARKVGDNKMSEF